MSIITRKIIQIIALGTLLANLAACTTPQSTPTMMDYSYVPPATATTPNWGIDDY